MRRFYSDPSLHQTVQGVHQPSSPNQTTTVNDACGSQTITSTPGNEGMNPSLGFAASIGGISPLQNTSPTIARRGNY